jgi:hypothetical protein
MSLSSKLIFGCVHMFATTFGAEQRAPLRQCKDAPYSGATQGTMPSSFFSKFFKKFRQLCQDQSHERKVFRRKLGLAKSKYGGLHGMMSCYLFKAPSANAPAATS